MLSLLALYAVVGLVTAMYQLAREIPRERQWCRMNGLPVRPSELVVFGLAWLALWPVAVAFAVRRKARSQ